MALEIKIETAFGVDAMYHRLVQVDYDFRAAAGTATLACYKDAATRKADKAPLTNYSVAISQMNDLDCVAIYKAVKQDENFAKAKDV
jgi:hypothetical protein